MRKRIVHSIIWGTLAAIVLAQTALTNDSIIKMLKAGLGEDIVLSTVKAQPGNFATGVDDLIALKSAGVGDNVIGAMVDKMASRGNPLAPAPASTPVPPIAAGVP